METLTFTDTNSNNWLFNKYYYAGSNSRYWTFQLTLNILNQTRKNPLIVETGCQRQAEDLGAGMSTSIFGEYLSKYGGRLITIDNDSNHLKICRSCTLSYATHINYVLSDSVTFLKELNETIDLLYLDSLDYPVGIEADNITKQTAAQEHCLNEFNAAAESYSINDKTLVLIDDNQLPQGGKPKILKKYLTSLGYICLLDLQQSLWIKSI